jgi:hypothetical protein
MDGYAFGNAAMLPIKEVALFEDLFKIDRVTVVIAGIGVVLLGPSILPTVDPACSRGSHQERHGLYDQPAELGEAACDKSGRSMKP